MVTEMESTKTSRNKSSSPAENWFQLVETSVSELRFIFELGSVLKDPEMFVEYQKGKLAGIMLLVPLNPDRKTRNQDLHCMLIGWAADNSTSKFRSLKDALRFVQEQFDGVPFKVFYCHRHGDQLRQPQKGRR